MTRPKRFDRDAFAREIRMRVADRNITLQDAAAEMGVGHSTICRVANLGKSPDVENYLRIKEWLATPRSLAAGGRS